MDERRRELRVGVAIALSLGLLVMLAIWVRGEAPVGEVRGQALGEVEKVVLVDAVRAVVREAELAPDGSYRVAVPRAAKTPSIVLHGPGGSLVESGPIHLEGEVAHVQSLALWRTPLRIRRLGERYRFDWAAIPAGPGYPQRRRYSVLLGYRRKAEAARADGEGEGERGETTLLSFDPQLELGRQELLDVLKDRDPSATELDVTLRAFDPGQEHGPLWVGARRSWDLEEEEE